MISLTFVPCDPCGQGPRIADVGTGERRVPVAKSLGAWLQYLREATDEKQQAAAALIPITVDAVRRVEAGQNVGLEFFLAFLAWLDNELGSKDPNRHKDFRDGLVEKLVEAGGQIRKRLESDPPRKEPDMPQPRAAAGGRRRRRDRAV